MITKTIDNETSFFGGEPKGLGGVFGGYGMICFLGIFFVQCCIPETKGKSLEQIQAELGGAKHTNGHDASIRP